MPWFPDFVNASRARLIRSGSTFAALNNGDPGELEGVWPGEVVIYDPRAGEIRGGTSGRPSSGPGRLSPAVLSAATRPPSAPATPMWSSAPSRRMGTSVSPSAPHLAHRGPAELRSFCNTCFSAGGGIGLQPCAVTDDGVRCALEYNCTRWGRHDLPPRPGIGVYERGQDGLLAAVRIYDDVAAPFEQR